MDNPNQTNFLFNTIQGYNPCITNSSGMSVDPKDAISKNRITAGIMALEKSVYFINIPVLIKEVKKLQPCFMAFCKIGRKNTDHIIRMIL